MFTKIKREIAAVVLLLSSSSICVDEASAMFVPTKIKHVPIARLIENLDADSASSQLTQASREFKIGRLYSMAWALGEADLLPVRYGSDFKEEWTIDEPFADSEQCPDYRQYPVRLAIRKPYTFSHLTKAINHYRKALELAPQNRTVKLGLAWCLDQRGNKTEAISIYREIIDEKSLKSTKTSNYDAVREYLSVSNGPSEKQLTFEAAQYLIPLLNKKQDEDEIWLLSKLPKPNYHINAVTPIVVPLEDNAPFEDIMQPAKVTFDMGLGSREYSSWPSSRAGWLVYDDGSSDIKSGYQLFGSNTFFLFWNNGYEALSSLDDNRDGKLTGPELQKLAVWQDKNSDGRSDSSEIISVDSLEIEAISCAGTTAADGTLSCRDGITFKSGKTRATWDVILYPKQTKNP